MQHPLPKDASWKFGYNCICGSGEEDVYDDDNMQERHRHRQRTIEHKNQKQRYDKNNLYLLR